MKESEAFLRVLCVDDDRDGADTLGVMLDLCGFVTCVCYDAESALTAAEDFRPDAAIVDLVMPGMDGDELGQMLRQKPWAQSLPMVALTALGDEEARQRTSSAGFDLHLTKPTTPDRLVNLLSDMVLLRMARQKRA